MNPPPLTSPLPTGHTLTTAARTIYNALRHLSAHRLPHRSGGYTADDIADTLGRASIPRDELEPVLDELNTAGLLRYCGDDDTGQFSTYAAIPTA